MSLPNLTLQTDKNNTSIDTDRITVRQSESGLVLTADLITANGGAYDLTNCLVLFGENKDGGKMVSDDDVSIIDKKGGRIKYLLNTAVYQASGDAWFEITDNANKLIDTTTNFHIEVVKQADLPVDNENYWSKAEGMLTHVQAFMQKIQNDVNSAMADDTGKINTFINNFQQTLDNYKAELATYDKAYTQLSSNWASELADIQSKASNAINDAVQNFSEQKKTIQSDANNTIAKIDADKKTAIDQANTNFKNKLDSIQSDYKEWKNTTISDFKSNLDELQQQLKNDEDTQAAIQKAIDAANKAISKIKDVDFTQYVKKEDFNKTIANINTINSPMDIDTTIDPDKITKAGFYIAKNGLAFGSYKAPQGYVAGKLTYLLQIAGESSLYGQPYWHQFVLQPNVGNYEIWHRITYDTGGSLIYTYTFINLKDIYSRVKQISINGGSAAKPDNDGLVKLTVPDPDLSKYETKADAEILENMLTAKINNLPISTMQNSINLALNKITALEARETFHYSSSISDAKSYSENNPQVLVGSK